ncbi:MAG TPA: NAD(P)/FAD-dependent oxidoreductase [Pyrinomonadaceae bacterium]|nr:NAD(P)/FAD-dependent oxidoreductase [Pyrinomonadaceae bacterium]
MEHDLFDCIVIGAGPAGLSASLFLARYRRSVLTLHDNQPRNFYSHGVHGFLGHHGIAPAELSARGMEEVIAHGGQIVEARATKIQKSRDGSFTVTTDREGKRPYSTRRVLLATGLRDVLPTCGGFREFYGSSIHHCPDCDGYEVSGKRVAVLGHGDSVIGLTLDLLTWTDKLTLLTDEHSEEMAQDSAGKLAAFNIPIRHEKVLALEGDVETRQLQRVRFSSGEALECDALFFNLGAEPVCRLHEALGCKTTKDFLWVDKTQQTSVEGIYAAGDITPNSHLAVVAAAEGAMAAIHIHQSLLPESRRV